MTREPAEPLRLDYLIKAGTIHSMTGKNYRSVGLRGAEIAAVSAEPDGLDDLAGVGTAVVDAGDLTLLPAFADSHEHLMEASRSTLLVPVDQARSVTEFTGMIAEAATWPWSTRPHCEPQASARTRPTRPAGRSGGYPTAAGTACWRLARCTRSRRSRRGRTGEVDLDLDRLA